MDNRFVNNLKAVLEVLQSQFNEGSSLQHYRYLLIDRLAVVSELSPLYDEALQDNIAPELLAVIKRPELAHSLASCPLLVCIAEPNEQLNKKLFVSALRQINIDYLTSKQYVCGFLASPLPPESLADELLNAGLIAGKALGRRFLPFYEPFTLDVLWHSYEAPKSHLGLLLPDDTHYYFINTNGDCCVFHAIDYEDEKDFAQRFVNPKLRFNLLNQAALYHLVVTWQDLCEQQKKPLSEQALSRIMALFYDPHATQLDNDQDRRAYVLFSLQYGQLMTNEELSKLIKEVIEDSHKQGQLGYLLSQRKEALSTLTQAQ